MSAEGVVSQWCPDEGWGVVDSPDMPGGCWVGFAELATSRFWEPDVGQRVELEWEQGDQDGYDYRAVRVWPLGSAPFDRASEPPGPGYRSSSTITVDD